MLTLVLCGAALAFPGLRTDGTVPAVGVAEGGVVGSGLQTLGGAMAPSSGLTGRIGAAEDIALELTLGWAGDQTTDGELRLQMPLLGRRDDPRLTLLAGVESAAVLSTLDGMPPWWAEAGVITGGNLGADLRLYGGAMASWIIVDGLDGLWVEPAVGLSWRPALGERLGMVVDLELAGSVDARFDAVALGPALVVGVGGR